MNVWVVTREIPGIDGVFELKVFASEEAAERHAEAGRKKSDRETFEVHECEVIQD